MAAHGDSFCVCDEGYVCTVAAGNGSGSSNCRHGHVGERAITGFSMVTCPNCQCVSAAAAAAAAASSSSSISSSTGDKNGVVAVNIPKNNNNNGGGGTGASASASAGNDDKYDTVRAMPGSDARSGTTTRKTRTTLTPHNKADDVSASDVAVVAASPSSVTKVGGGGGGAAASVGDKRALRIIYIKSFKVASTTVSSILQRLADENGWKVANRYNSVGVQASRTYNLILGHNFYDFIRGRETGPGCFVGQRRDGGSGGSGTGTTWTSCGGYQPWMDEFVPDAFHLIMVSEPMARIASMYYYESQYTKLKDRMPGDTEYGRMNPSQHFGEPRSPEGERFIQRWLDNDYAYKWERVQWWWLREATPGRSLEETLELLRRKFVIGLTHRFDESILLWRRILDLDTRDILYAPVKAQLSHPKITEWSEKHQDQAARHVQETKDDAYYHAAHDLFERQIRDYGSEKLATDLAAYRKLTSQLNTRCADTFLTTEVLHVPDRVFCFLKHYDAAYEQRVETKKYLGCYSDLAPKGAGGGARYQMKMMSRVLTVSACRRRCLKDKLQHFALYFGESCFCGPRAPPQEMRLDDDNRDNREARCNVPCSGDKSEMCGGASGYSVYVNMPRQAGVPDPIISLD